MDTGVKLGGEIGLSGKAGGSDTPPGIGVVSDALDQATGVRLVAAKMKNDYQEFKETVSSRFERKDMLLTDEVRENFWSNLADWLVLLSLMFAGLVAVVWLFFFY
jgi:hypothetical protein